MRRSAQDSVATAQEIDKRVKDGGNLRQRTMHLTTSEGGNKNFFLTKTFYKIVL